MKAEPSRTQPTATGDSAGDSRRLEILRLSEFTSDQFHWLQFEKTVIGNSPEMPAVETEGDAERKQGWLFFSSGILGRSISTASVSQKARASWAQLGVVTVPVKCTLECPWVPEIC